MVAINTDVVDSIEMRDRAKIPLTVNVRAKISNTGTPPRLSGQLRVDLTPCTRPFRTTRLSIRRQEDLFLHRLLAHQQDRPPASLPPAGGSGPLRARAWPSRRRIR